MDSHFQNKYAWQAIFIHPHGKEFLMANTVKDPVCGMEIDPQTAAGTSEYQGQTYYFCAPGCKRSFDKDPEKYLAQSDRAQNTNQ
jgi:YHS domain-containing protein